jgi:hypothetical protein
VVARYRHVRREQFVMAVDNLRSANATVLGTILTQVPSKLHQARYGDDYDYAHPTGQAVGATEDLRPTPSRESVETTARTGTVAAPQHSKAALVHPPTKPVPGDNRPKQSGAGSGTKRPGQSATGRNQGAGRPRT